MCTSLRDSRLVNTFEYKFIYFFQTQLMTTIMTTVERFKEGQSSSVCSVAVHEIMKQFSLRLGNLTHRNVLALTCRLPMDVSFTSSGCT